MVTIPLQPDCQLVGELVEIRPLHVDDLPELAAWPPHADPLLQEHNVSFRTMAGWQRWLRERQRRRWPYAVRNQAGELVGHLSLREIDHPCSSRLGISMAPPFVGWGYGTDAMRTFLDHYFGPLGFREMRLDVSGANLRARHLYERLGFRVESSFWRLAPVSSSWYKHQERAVRRHFRHGKLQFFEMCLSAADWFLAD